jgi:hypothetical protein
MEAQRLSVPGEPAMSLVEVNRSRFEPLPVREPAAEILGSYKGALERAIALGPAVRAERAALEALPQLERVPARPPAIRRAALGAAIIAAAIGTPLFTSASSPPVLALGAAFGLASAAAGDRFGGALRRLAGPVPWRRRAALASAAALPVIEATLLACAAVLLTGSVLAGAALAAAAIALAFVSHATRKRDAEIETRAALHARIQQRLQATEQAMQDAMTAVRVAHAADLARVAGEMGETNPLPDPARHRPQ